MFFEDWKDHKHEEISKTILWEYNTESKEWDWMKMKKIVVRRVLEYGRPEDYYAMLQLYGGFSNVAEIIKTIPKLSPREISWSCVLFKIKKEDLLCCKRQQLRQTLLNC